MLELKKLKHRRQVCVQLVRQMHDKHSSSKQAKIYTRIGFARSFDIYVAFVSYVRQTKQTEHNSYHILLFARKTTPHSQGETKNGAPRWRRQWNRFVSDSPFCSVFLHGTVRQGDCWVRRDVFLRREGLWRRWDGRTLAPWGVLGESVIFVLEKFRSHTSCT